MKKAYFIIMMMALVALFMVPAAAFAAMNPVGTVILAPKWDNLMYYTDLGGQVTVEIFGTTSEVTVTAMYGIAFPNAGQPADQPTTPNVAVYYSYQIRNNANNSDPIALTYTESYSGSETGWAVSFYSDANGNGIVDGADAVITTPTLGEDAVYNFIMKVVPRSIAAANSTDTITVTASSAATGPVGIYTGANGTTYGGVRSGTDQTITTITAGSISMTRVASVDAPNVYTGGRHDPVPGAAITYKITYEAAATAGLTSVIIVDKVPTTTTALHMGAYSGRQGNVTNVTISVTMEGTGTTEGWREYWTAQVAPTFDFGNYSQWTLVPDTNNLTLEVGSTVRFVKWEKDTVAAGEKGKLTWGVTIK